MAQRSGPLAKLVATARRRLRNLLVKEVSLVDDGDNPGARILMFKRAEDGELEDELLHHLTDDELVEVGKAFHLPGQASSAADCPPGWRFDAERRMCIREARGGGGRRPFRRQQPTASSVHVDSPLGEDGRPRRRRRGRRRRTGGSSHLQKLKVETAVQESGGVSPHPHELDLPDGVIAAGTYRTDEVQAHRHDTTLPSDVRPGETVTVETGNAIPDPPPGVENHTHTVRITAAEREPVERSRELEKQATKREAGEDFPAAAFAFAPDRERPSTWKLRLFESVADVSANRPSIVQTGQVGAALSPGGFRGNPVDIPASARAGVIRRARAAWLRARRDRDVTADDLPEVLKFIGRPVRRRRSGGKRMATEYEFGFDIEKADLKPEVKKALDDLQTIAAEAEDKLETAESKITKLEKDKDPDHEDDPLEGVPEEVRKIVEPQLKAATDRTTAVEKENATLKGRLDKIEAETERTTFEKGVGDLTGLPDKREALIESLWTIPDVEKRANVQKSFEAAAAAARRGGVLGEVGSELDGGGSAYAKIEAVAAEIRKANPEMSEAVSKAKAMTENPELYDQFLEEDSAVH